MTVSRYSFARRSKGFVGPSRASYIIYHAVQRGTIYTTVRTLEAGQRLDQIAGTAYGDSSLWWVIAAASGIGWGLQAPPGVVIKIPTDINKVLSLLI